MTAPPTAREALEALDEASAQLAERESCYLAFSKLKLVRAFIEPSTSTESE